MIDNKELDRLEQLAKNAHQDWAFNMDGCIYYVDETKKDNEYEGRTAICQVQSSEADFYYMYTFNPSKAIELIEEIRRLKTLVGEYD